MKSAMTPGKPSKYPKLMVNDDNDVVFFIEPMVGACIAGPDIGEYAIDWEMSAFHDFTGTVTLEN